MADQTEMIVQVDTEKLLSVAGEVEQKIQSLKNTFDAIGQRIKNSLYYWEGNGSKVHIEAYQRKIEMIQEALERFQENVDNLRKITGNYEETDRKITADNQVLPTNLLD